MLTKRLGSGRVNSKEHEGLSYGRPFLTTGYFPHLGHIVCLFLFYTHEAYNRLPLYRSLVHSWLYLLETNTEPVDSLAICSAKAECPVPIHGKIA